MSIYTSTILQDSPVAWWRLGELTGSVAADSSGNGNAGAYTGGCTLGLAGAIAGENDPAAALDGTSGYIAAPNSASLSITAAITLEIWAKIPNGVGATGLICKAEGAYYLSVNHDNAAAGLVGLFLSGASSAWLTSATPVDDGNWRHIVAVYDGSTVAIYIDGVINASSSLSGAISTNTKPVNIGARDPAGATWFLQGEIDEAAIYSTALSAARIKAHYNAGIAQGVARRVIFE